MRLGQLSRKLALRPAELVTFLAKNKIAIEDGSNVRLQEEHVVLIMNHYAPAQLDDVMVEPDEETPAEVIPTQEIAGEMSLTPEIQTVEGRTELDEVSQEKTEVIKTQKVELPGLKVLGKIEFPEPKKKEVPSADPEQSANPPVPVEEVRKPRTENRKWPQPRNDRRDQRPKKNPVALEREREANEAEEKRKVEIERKKELKRQHYYKKVKPSAPTKAMKLVNDEVEEISPEQINPPKTAVGRFFKWLTT